MSEWIETTLGDCLDELLDYRGKSPPKIDTGLPVISAKVVKNGRISRDIQQQIDPNFYKTWMTRGFPKVGDVVLTTEGPLGEVAQLDYETVNYALAQRIVVLRGKKNVLDNNFLKFLLLSPKQQEILNSYATGTTVAGISQKSLRNIPISIPSFSEQILIGRLLGSLDDKIELNHRMNETLEALARAIFKEWFVDFGPVRAKMEGRDPDDLAPEIAALFPDALDADGKPMGWEVGTLGDVVLLNPESWSKKTAPQEINYVDLANTKWGIIENVTFFEWSTAPSRAQRVLREGDTIIGTVRPGNGSYAYISSDGLTGSTGFAVLRPKSHHHREFVYLAATDILNIERLSHLADGGAYPAVRPEVVLNTPIIYSSPPIITTFSRIIKPFINTIEHNKLESQTLAELRDVLLPKLISGEIRVSDVDVLPAFSAEEATR